MRAGRVVSSGPQPLQLSALGSRRVQRTSSTRLARCCNDGPKLQRLSSLSGLHAELSISSFGSRSKHEKQELFHPSCSELYDVCDAEQSQVKVIGSGRHEWSTCMGTWRARPQGKG